MAEESQVAVKHGWGKNPASLANLKPIQPGEYLPAPSREGPYVTPALKRLCAERTWAEVCSLDLDTLKPHEVAAVTLLRNAMTPIVGQRSLEVLLSRLDGEVPKQLQIDAGIQVTYVVRDTDAPSSP